MSIMQKRRGDDIFADDCIQMNPSTYIASQLWKVGEHVNPYLLRKPGDAPMVTIAPCRERASDHALYEKEGLLTHTKNVRTLAVVIVLTGKSVVTGNKVKSQSALRTVDNPIINAHEKMRTPRAAYCFLSLHNKARHDPAIVFVGAIANECNCWISEIANPAGKFDVAFPELLRFPD